MERVETLIVSSIERLLTPEEADGVTSRMAEVIAASPPQHYEAARGERSIHGIDGLSIPEVVAVYEPNGRLEVPSVPADVTALVNEAIERRMADIRRLVPSVRSIDEWTYVEYRRGEYVSPHVDYSQNADCPDRPKVVGIGIQLNDQVTGGEFFVETTAAAELWTAGALDVEVRAAANNHSEWFRALPRTRWTTRAAKGSALLYGTRVVHGTCPVVEGISRKLIGWLLG